MAPRGRPTRTTRSRPVTTTPPPVTTTPPPVTDPTTTTSVTSAQLQAMIDEGVNAVLAARAATRNGDDQDFMKCQPVFFRGTEEVVNLTQWFEAYQLIRHIHQLDTTYQPFHSEQRIDLYSLNNVSVLPNNTAYSVRSIRRTDLQKTIQQSSSPELDLFSDVEEHPEEETTEIMTEIMDQYMSKTRGDYGSGVVRPKINDKTHFELKGQYLKKLRENTLSSSEHEDANEHIEKVLEIIYLFHIPEVTQDQVML
ncbi:hypothetical protein Tco_1321325 [Tanacetum coccineum]